MLTSLISFNQLMKDNERVGRTCQGPTEWDKQISTTFYMVSCVFLLESVVFENVHFPNAVISRKSEKSQPESVKMRRTAKLIPFVPFSLSLSVCPLLAPRMLSVTMLSHGPS